MTGFRLCVSCDALRDVERCFCQNCGEATDSYKYEPSEREEFELLAMASSRAAAFDGDIINQTEANKLRSLGRMAA